MKTLITILVITYITAFNLSSTVAYANIEGPKPRTIIQAKVTGYNTVPEQTDSTSCVASSGDNICGRNDVVACPRSIPLKTKVDIDGKEYICLDRLALKYDNRFDISCDKDFECPYKVSGYKQVIIK